MNSVFEKEFYKTYLVYFIPVACSFLFFWRLGEASFWFDELVTLKTVSGTTLDVFFMNYASDHLHPPLYFLLLKIYIFISQGCQTTVTRLSAIVILNIKISNRLYDFMQIPLFDFNQLFKQYLSANLIHNINLSSEGFFRFPSAVFLTAANIAVFDFFKKSKMLLVGIMTSLLIGTNTELIFYAQDARPYALFILMFVLVATEFERTYSKELKSENLKQLLFLNGLMMLTHYYAVFIIGGELLILMLKNRKNSKFLVFCLMAFLVGILAFIEIFKIIDVTSMNLLTTFRFAELKLIHLRALGYFSEWRFFLIGGIFLIVKRIAKKNSTADGFVINFTLFFALTVLLIYLFSLLRPVFSIRYVVFLIPLEISAIVCLYFSMCEGLFLFVKDKKLLNMAVAASFLILTGKMAVEQSEFHFYVFDYYRRDKYYPLKDAYELIARDKNYRAGAGYILEEYMGTYFRYYEEKYQINQLTEVNPKAENIEKEKKVNALAATRTLDVIYYIRVRHKETSQNAEPISLDHYTRRLISKNQNIETYKFIKEF